MALKGNWIDKVNGVDDVDASDINSLAHAIIELEESGGTQLTDGDEVAY